MPLYEYECDSCGTRSEKIRKFADPPLEICEACGGPLRKLVSSPAIQFKGSGWYITDYAKKTAVEGTRPEAGETKPAGDAKTDTAKSDGSSTAKPTSASTGDGKS